MNELVSVPYHTDCETTATGKVMTTLQHDVFFKIFAKLHHVRHLGPRVP